MGWFLDALISTEEIMLFSTFYCNNTKLKYGYVKTFWCYFGFFMSSFFILPLIRTNFIIKIPCAILFNFASVWILSGDKKMKKWGILFSWFVLMEVSDFASVGLYNVFLNGNLSNFFNLDNNYRIISKGFFSPVFFSVSSIFTIVNNKVDKTARSKLMLLFVVVPFGQIPLLFGACYYGYEQVGARIILFVLACLCITLCSNFLIYPTLCTSVASVESEKKLEFLSRQKEWESRYYQMAEENAKKIAWQKHDVKNQLQLAYALMESDSVSAQILLQEIKLNLTRVEEIYYCKNKILNMLFSIKSAEAFQNDVVMEIKISDSVLDLPFSDLDWSSLFSNLLDNAMEGCERNRGEENYISLTMGQQSGYKIIKLTNSCDSHTVHKHQDEYMTSKPDKAQHGFGLSQIQSIVARYSGELQIQCSQGVFEVLICFPE